MFLQNERYRVVYIVDKANYTTGEIEGKFLETQNIGKNVWWIFEIKSKSFKSGYKRVSIPENYILRYQRVK